jgi:hypothetical protein
MSNRRRRKRRKGGLTVRKAPATANQMTVRAFAVRAETINDADRSVEAVLATETPVQVFDFERFEVVDETLRMDGVVLPNNGQVPLMDTHPEIMQARNFSTVHVIGSTRNIRVENGQLLGTNVFASPEASHEAQQAWLKVREGHITQNSIGYAALNSVYVPRGKTQMVNGRSYTAGQRMLKVTTRWSPKENSLVPFGADELAGMRAGNSATEREDQSMNLEQWLHARGLTLDGFRTWLTDRSMVLADLEDDQAKEQAEVYASSEQTGGEDPADGESGEGAAPPATPPAPASGRSAPANGGGDAIQRAITAERQRATAIRSEGRSIGMSDELIERAVSEGMDITAARGVFIQQVRDQRGQSSGNPGTGPAIQVRDHERDCNARTLCAGMLVRAGLDRIPNNLPDAERSRRAQNFEQGRRYEDHSMIDICRESIRLMGGRVPNGRSDTIQMALMLSRQAEQSRYLRTDDVYTRAPSTGSLSNIFSTVLGAQLLESYTATVDTTEPWTRRTDVPNFQTNERTSLGKGGALEKLPRGDEAKHDTWSDSAESYKIARYAKQFIVDEQDIIDDRFSALMDKPADMGEAAAQLIPDLVYSILFANAALGADAVALFDAATHANLNTTSALSSTTLKVAVNTIAVQKQGERNLNLRGRYLLVPQNLLHTARELVNSSTIMIAAAGDTDATFERGTLNTILADNLEIISDSRLDNGVTDPASGNTHTGVDDTWYLIAGNTRRTIEVGFLRGAGRSPQTRSFVLTEGKWGVGWDIKFDVGAKALDFRGMCQNTA